MSNEYMSVQVNYNAILEALENATRKVWTEWGKRSARLEDAAWNVGDYKTIGFTVGRQCGGTRAVSQWIKKHKNQCLLITKDTKMMDTFKATYCSREGGEVDDFYGMVPRINGDITKYAVQGYDGVPEIVKANIRYVIVDDASIQFNHGHIKRRAFNQWVADNFNEDTFVILIK